MDKLLTVPALEVIIIRTIARMKEEIAKDADKSDYKTGEYDKGFIEGAESVLDTIAYAQREFKKDTLN